MGIDEGFDIHPPLTVEHRDCWHFFLVTVKKTLINDTNVVIQPDRIDFNVGECPSLYSTVEKNRRFSSKTSSTRTALAVPYIKTVMALASRIFPDNIHWWSEYAEADPCYRWGPVYEAQRLATNPEDIILLTKAPHRPSFVMMKDILCTEVFRAFEQIHVGMDGLQLASASFPPNE
jgi:hypothetical protein